MHYRNRVMPFCTAFVGILLVFAAVNQINRRRPKTEHQVELRFFISQTNVDTPMQRLDSSEKSRRRNECIRLLRDWFDDWRYGSQGRSKPLFLEVLKMARECTDMTCLTDDELHTLVKKVQFVVEDDASGSLPVIAKVVVRAQDSRIAEVLVGVYRECLSNYVSEANTEQEERATSAYRGEYLAKENALAKLRSRLSAEGLSGGEKARLERKAAALEDDLAEVRMRIEAAKMSARGCGRKIVFPMRIQKAHAESGMRDNYQGERPDRLAL